MLMCQGVGRRSPPCVLLLLAISLALIGCVTAEKATKSAAHRDLGVTYLNEGNLEAALNELVIAKDLHPRNAEVRHSLGMALFAKGLYAKAEEELKAALRFDSSLTEAKLNLASLYIAQDRYEEAITLLQVVTADYLYRKPSRAYNNLGWCYYKLGRPDEAIVAYQQALRMVPKFCQASYNLAIVYDEQNNLDYSAQLLDQSVTDCPDELRFRFRLGVTLARLDRDDEALENLEQVVTADPSGPLGAEARAYIRSLR